MLKTKDLVLAACAVIVIVGLFYAIKVEPTGRPHFQHSELLITRADKTHFQFLVEVAVSPEEQSYGLMFLHKLAEDAGMIFPYNPPHQVAFWMKNTLIPLDMLFIRPNGAIGRIVSEARPEDLTPISSLEPVIAVIELKGGIVKKDGLAVGDKVDSPAIMAVGGSPLQ